METAPRHDKWNGTTGGTTWMQKTLSFCLGWMNLPFVYSGMALIIPFYMLFNHQEYLSQYHFFRHRLGYGWMRSFICVYINHFAFGQVILDRFAVYGGAKFEVEIEGNNIFLDKIRQKEGFIQLSSHIGNFELAGYMLRQEQKIINALVFGGETETMMRNREHILNKMNVKLIPVGTEMNHVYVMKNALEHGEIISMPGDRNFGSQKVITCSFFNAEADFPMGPYIMAAIHNVPLLSIFVMKQSVHKYHIYVNEVSLSPEMNFKSSRDKAFYLAQSFALQLEKVVRKYPYQWFNYYEYWHE